MKKNYEVNSSKLAKEFHLNTEYSVEKIRQDKNKLLFYDIAPPRKIVSTKKVINLTKKKEASNILYQTIENRQSYNALDIRVPIDFSDFSELLIRSYTSRENDSNFIKSVPSAGARYSTSLFILIFNVINLEPGIYYWNPYEKQLGLIYSGSFRKDLIDAVLDNNKKEVENCSFAIIISSNINQTLDKYGDRGYRFVCMDIGYISQNLYLISTHLKLNTRAIGGFYDRKLSAIIPNDTDEPFLIHLFGKEPKFAYEQIELEVGKYFNN